MIPAKENTRLSKLLSYILRHNPQEVGITLDGNGWVSVDVLLNQLAKHGHDMHIDVLRYIVTSNAKQRFSFNDGATMIRASQGHSVEVDLNLPAKQPPEFLYHGTVGRFIAAILKEGLKKMDRQHVHLSADTATAIQVAERRGQAVILKIKAGDMFLQGHVFCLSANGVWLTDAVPPEFIQDTAV